MNSRASLYMHGRCIARARIMMERLLGRTLFLDEVVHHVNGDPTDDRPENLRLMRRGEHSRLHGHLCHPSYQNKHDHARRFKGGFRVARLVMGQMLGRILRSDEVVHHVNGDPGDDRPENLQLMSREGHSRLHGFQKKIQNNDPQDWIGRELCCKRSKTYWLTKEKAARSK